MNKDLISVIIPVYNAEKYLIECIDSVRKQTYDDLEIILIDDGSTDKSGEICDKYEKKDTRIKVFHQRNAGVSAARNLGVQHAQGNWIAFVDADDILMKDAYEHMLMTGFEAELIIGKIVLLNSDGTKEKLVRDLNGKSISKKEFLFDLFEEKKYSYLGFPCDKLYRREIIEKWSIKFNSDVKINEDRLFVLEYVQHCEEINICDKEIYLYRQRDKKYMTEDERKRIVTDSVLTVIEAFIQMQNLGKKYSDELYYLICHKSFESALDMLSRTKKNDKAKLERLKSFLKDSTEKCLNNPNVSCLEKAKVGIHYLLKR